MGVGGGSLEKGAFFSRIMEKSEIERGLYIQSRICASESGEKSRVGEEENKKSWKLFPKKCFVTQVLDKEG
jgi:hypothetical protein